MTEKQPHLCSWVPIAIPFTTWHVSPAPLGHWLFGFFPVLAPFVMKFYDALSMFRCPPSYIMTASKAKEVFPQLAHDKILYCSVFYEAQHNDSRTNLAIALSAAEHGAEIANYVEMVDVVRDENSKKIIGVQAVDRQTGTKVQLRAKNIVFAGGPFTDDLREMEVGKGETAEPAVQGGAGTHIVLPSKYCSSEVSLVFCNGGMRRIRVEWQPFLNRTLVGRWGFWISTLVTADSSSCCHGKTTRWLEQLTKRNLPRHSLEHPKTKLSGF